MDNFSLPNMWYDQRRNEDDDEVYMFMGTQEIGRGFAFQGNAQSQPLGATNGAQGIFPAQGQQMTSRSGIPSAYPNIHTRTAQRPAYLTYPHSQLTISHPYNQYYADQQHLYQPPQHMNPSFPTLHSSTVPRSQSAWTGTPQTLVDPQSLGGTPQIRSRGGGELPRHLFDQNFSQMNHHMDAVQGAYSTQPLSPGVSQNTAFAAVSSVNYTAHGAFDPSLFPPAVVPPSEVGLLDRGMSISAESSQVGQPSAENTAQTVQTFVCMIDACGQNFPVDKTLYTTHLLSHEYGPVKRSRAVECRWTSCACARQGPCKGRDAGHGWHGENVLEHIWDMHLAFQDPCPQCGDVRWQHQFSKERHAKTCPGRKPARCRGCATLFKSFVALAGHVELEQCVGSGASVEIVG